MNDVFISYARADRESAHRLADVLEAQGLSVWWDHDLAPGQKFATVIAEELASARCVLVLWSQASIASHWVADEAAEGQRRSVLVPAIIEGGMQPPLGFRGLQTADLSDWVRGGSDAALQRLCQAVYATVHRLKPPPAPPSPPPKPPPPRPPDPPPELRRPSTFKRNVAIAIAILAVGGVYEAWNSGELDLGRETLPEVATAALQGPVVWQDYVLRYSGNVQWDGQSPTATLTATLVDMPTGRSLGQGSLLAQVTRFGAQQVELGANFDVAGDSQGNYPHSHNVNLLFQHDGASWALVRNCMRTPGRPEQCW